MTGTRLDGLDGRNPLAFLAALGLQVAFAEQPEQPRLWWTEEVAPRALVDSEFSIDRIVDTVMASLRVWSLSPALDPGFGRTDDVKFDPVDLRRYLELTRDHGPTSQLAQALVAEGSLDGQGKAKPTDLYFTAGRQLFLAIARRILGGVIDADIRQALNGPWPYTSDLPSLMWDVTDDRIYALSAFDPAGEKKRTNPGAEALALLGLSTHPVFAGADRTVSTGCSGIWKHGAYTWPLWARPAGPGAVRSLVAHVSHPEHPDYGRRTGWFPAWGVSLVLQSEIRRSDQGGYGTFGPPRVVWTSSANG